MPPGEVDRLAIALRAVSGALEVGAPGADAEIRERAGETLAWLRLQPWGAPYADWLAGRIIIIDTLAEAPSPFRTVAVTGPALLAVEACRSTLRFEVLRARLRPWGGRLAWDRRALWPAPPPRALLLAPQLQAVFLSQGLPPEMAWLAEVESLFDPAACSPAGARGVFQLMPATAGRFGLALFPFDERLDPEKSARAAARYLRVLYREFGDWPLALAAYNAGEGRVGRALARTAGRNYDAIAGLLPAETRGYVPWVLATVAMRGNVDPFALPEPGALPPSPTPATGSPAPAGVTSSAAGR